MKVAPDAECTEVTPVGPVDAWEEDQTAPAVPSQPAQEAALRAALEGLRDGSATSGESAQLLREFMDERYARRPEGGMDAAFQSAFARLSEAPTNWHQGTVFFLATEAQIDASMRRRAPLLYCVGLCMVLFQACAGALRGATGGFQS